jgi:hypothetical protein
MTMLIKVLACNSCGMISTDLAITAEVEPLDKGVASIT